MIDWKPVRTLTFDCYGTIIDWERGIADSLVPLLAAHGVDVAREEALRRFAAHEHAAEAPGRRYRDALAAVLRAIGADLGFSPTDDECAAFGRSVGEWPPFPDSAAALRRLATRFELVILSNVDDDLFAASAGQLDGVQFAHVVTAQQVGSYKPDPTHFRVGLDRIGRPQREIVHVAQSLFHDHAPAKALGFTTVWINRRGDDGGSGATPAANATPDLVLPDLASLAAVATAVES
jgi:2-haloacid dehalogenase